MRVAALFVETDGCYFGLDGIDPWDERRDARLYSGPWPVVAHPPCARWGRYAGAHGKRAGDDDGCLASALDAVRRYGGVLEHPAGSKAWLSYCLPLPPVTGWRHDLIDESWVCRVEQGYYGHAARKSTWLYYHGYRPPPELLWGNAPQRSPAFQLATRGYESARRCGMIGNMSQAQRQRTPVEFRDLLLGMARNARL